MPMELSNNPKQTLIEQGTTFKGTLKGACPIIVHGKVEGEIDAPEVTIAPSGSVVGSIKAQRLRSEGSLSGRIDAGTVFLSGTVGSDTVIKAKTLEVKLGSDSADLEVKFGKCDLNASSGAEEKQESEPPVSASHDGGERPNGKHKSKPPSSTLDAAAKPS